MKTLDEEFQEKIDLVLKSIRDEGDMSTYHAFNNHFKCKKYKKIVYYEDHRFMVFVYGKVDSKEGVVVEFDKNLIKWCAVSYISSDMRSINCILPTNMNIIDKLKVINYFNEIENGKI
jgi:hypothetical protein